MTIHHCHIFPPPTPSAYLNTQVKTHVLHAQYFAASKCASKAGTTCTNTSYNATSRIPFVSLMKANSQGTPPQLQGCLFPHYGYLLPLHCAFNPPSWQRDMDTHRYILAHSLLFSPQDCLLPDPLPHPKIAGIHMTLSRDQQNPEASRIEAHPRLYPSIQCQYCTIFKK